MKPTTPRKVSQARFSSIAEMKRRVIEIDRRLTLLERHVDAALLEISKRPPSAPPVFVPAPDPITVPDPGLPREGFYIGDPLPGSPGHAAFQSAVKQLFTPASPQTFGV